jgi:hypothetical protein
VALGIAGVAGIASFVHRLGTAAMLAALMLLAPYVPLLLALEGVRIAVDALTTHQLYRAASAHAPFPVVLKAQLLSYPANLLLPAGRVTAEVIKAGALHRWVGLERTVAAAVMSQSLVLLATALVTLPCIVAAFASWGASALTYAITLQAVTGVGGAALVAIGARRRVVGKGLKRLSAALGAVTERAQDELRTIGWLPARPLAAALANRLLLAAETGLAAIALGLGGGVRPLLVIGMQFVGAAAGDVVPAQMGATEGALALAAESLGADMANLVAIALSLHAVQLTWAVIGAVLALASKPRQPAPLAEP